MTRADRAAPLRIGVLGAARITGSALAAPARALGHRVVALAARDRARAEAAAAEHDAERVVGSYAELVADPEVEVVYDPLPNGLHGPWNLAAVAAGKHVLTEKPAASNAAEAAAVRDPARRAGVVVLEAFHYRFHPVFRRIEELLASGELGELRRVEAELVMPAPPDDDPRWSRGLAGGALMDLGCYALHAHRALEPFGGGPPEVVSARADERAGVDERLTAELVFPGGAAGRAHCDMASPESRNTCRVVGSRGEALATQFVLPQRDDRVVVRVGGAERTERLGTRPTFEFQLAALAGHLRAGTPLPHAADDGLGTMELVDACYRAAGMAPHTAQTG